MTAKNPLWDLLEAVKKDNDEGRYPIKLDPKEYGFDDEEEMWRRIRELAGVPEPKPGKK